MTRVKIVMGWIALCAVVLGTMNGEQISLRQVHVQAGAGAGDRFGESIALVGDFDADGADELVVGVPGDDTTGEDAGAVIVISGRTHKVIAIYYGEGAGDHFGFAVSAARDIAFDGFDRIVVGAPGHDDSKGAAYVYGGSKGRLAFRVVGKRAGDQLGFAVADGADADNDGRFDILVGSPGYDGKGGEDAGRVLLISGRSSSKKVRIVQEWGGRSVLARFGSSCVTVRSAASGKFHAVAVGAPHSLRPQDALATGAVHVFDTKTGDPMYSLYGETEGERFGHDLVELGQWRPIDGSADFAVSRSGGSRSVTIHSGTDGALLHVFEPVEGDGRFGWSLAAADLDWDGIPELIVGIPATQGKAGARAGRSMVRVYSGKQRTMVAELHPTSASDVLGASVTSAGNFGASGFAALAITAVPRSPGPGSVHIFTTAKN